MKFVRTLVIACSVLATQSDAIAYAQAARDMWVAFAEATGAFAPHHNFCTTTEAFITVGAGDLGFCIEKDERSAAVWVAAKQACAEDGKRLPEPAEFQYVCKNLPGGVSNMTDDMEWASNIPYNELLSPATGVTDLQVVSMGNGSCTITSSGVIGRNTTGYQDSLPYRCVR